MPHYIENIGDGHLIFLEVFPTPYYEDISLSEWLAHLHGWQTNTLAPAKISCG